MVIKYVTETEEHYDYLYIDINGINRVNVSGVVEAQFSMENTTTEENQNTNSEGEQTNPEQ